MNDRLLWKYKDNLCNTKNTRTQCYKKKINKWPWRGDKKLKPVVVNSVGGKFGEERPRGYEFNRMDEPTAESCCGCCYNTEYQLTVKEGEIRGSHKGLLFEQQRCGLFASMGIVSFSKACPTLCWRPCRLHVEATRWSLHA